MVFQQGSHASNITDLQSDLKVDMRTNRIREPNANAVYMWEIQLWY